MPFLSIWLWFVLVFYFNSSYHWLSVLNMNVYRETWTLIPQMAFSITYSPICLLLYVHNTVVGVFFFLIQFCCFFFYSKVLLLVEFSVVSIPVLILAGILLHFSVADIQICPFFIILTNTVLAESKQNFELRGFHFVALFWNTPT